MLVIHGCDHTQPTSWKQDLSSVSLLGTTQTQKDVDVWIQSQDGSILVDMYYLKKICFRLELPDPTPTMAF